MYRKDREKDAAFAWQVLREAPFGTLSLVNGNGEPYAVPISHVAVPEKNCLYFHCAKVGAKMDIFREGCPAVLSAVSRADVIPNQYEMDYASAVAKGRLEVVTEDGERRDALFVLCERYDPGRAEKFAESMKKYGANTCVVRMDVSELTGKAYSK